MRPGLRIEPSVMCVGHYGKRPWARAKWARLTPAIVRSLGDVNDVAEFSEGVAGEALRVAMRGER